METVLRWGLFFIAALVIFLIFYDIWFRRSKSVVENDKEGSMLESAVEPVLNPKNMARSIEQDVLANTQEYDNKSRTHVTTQLNNPITQDDIVIISILAQPDTYFASYDLLQAISATGMQYGDMDIFHYYQKTDEGPTVTLFSLASATKPGTFDLDRMGDFFCAGLSLFMNKRTVSNPKQVFKMMLEKAEQLADDLNGELRVGVERKPLTEDILNQYL